MLGTSLTPPPPPRSQQPNPRLAADRSAVETDLQAQAVQIKNIEMNNIDRYLQAIGTQAALICGFAAAVSYAVELAKTVHPLLILGYYFFNTSALLFEMYCVMNATLVSVLGPTFALNGPKGSMHESVQYMKEERLVILSAFWTGACCFGMAQIFTFFIIAPVETAIPCSICIILGFEVIRRSMDRIKRKFRYEEIYAGDDDGRGGTQVKKRKQTFHNIFGGSKASSQEKDRPVRAQSFLQRELERDILEAPGTNI
ncbi:hypothetical protein TrCOL_g8670 [Triparma columacea]|uniref:Uncharacterized protein n=1 Tax=Triparma columacea TaxID=722753 RepID=A0A9W7L7L9_9STRA|nr:hypothetical protein TrCOL_g8670 [Triparma columacea]